MGLAANGIMKKLRKFRRDPTLFFYDYLGKRIASEQASFARIDAAGEQEFETSDYDVVDSVAIITKPDVVDRLRQLKQKSAKKPPRVALVWWN